MLGYKAIDGKSYPISQVEDYLTNIGLLLPNDIDEEEGITVFDGITVYPVYRYTLIGIHGDLYEPLLASENITEIEDVKRIFWTVYLTLTIFVKWLI